MITEQIENIKKQLLASPKERIVGIATTADKNNPPFILGSLRETRTTIAATVILRDIRYLDEIISTFDGEVDYFFLDSEVKNEVLDLEKRARAKIIKSKIFTYKPNDFTVESLDMLVSLLYGSLVGKKVLIIGAGNIGSKTALKLCERGADVYLANHHFEKVEKIVEGLNLIKRSTSEIHTSNNPGTDAQGVDLIIGATPGTPAITKEMVAVMNPNGKIIDAGNRTIVPDALAYSRERGIEALSLNSLGGYTGMIENWIFQRDILSKPRSKSMGDYSLITPGTLGIRGDVLVNDIETPSRVFGVCDGLGGLLPKEEGVTILKQRGLDRFISIC